MKYLDTIYPEGHSLRTEAIQIFSELHAFVGRIKFDELMGVPGAGKEWVGDYLKRLGLGAFQTSLFVCSARLDHYKKLGGPLAKAIEAEDERRRKGFVIDSHPTILVVAKTILESCKEGKFHVIIDGYPRCPLQYEFFMKIFPDCPDMVKNFIYLNMTKEFAMRRIAKRRAASAVPRPDDAPEIAGPRFDRYVAGMEPVLAAAEQEGTLRLIGEEFQEEAKVGQVIRNLAFTENQQRQLLDRLLQPEAV